MANMEAVKGAPVTVRIRNNGPFSFQTALDYLKALEPDSLPRTIEDCIKNDAELIYYLPPALLNAPPRRPLEFNPDIVPRNFDKGFGTWKPYANIGALLVYVTGVYDPTAAVQCYAVKKFYRCVFPDQRLDYTTRWSAPTKGKKTSNAKCKPLSLEVHECFYRGPMADLLHRL